MEKARKRAQAVPPVSMADPEQSERFIEAARELGADQSEESFDEALRKIARAPVQRPPRGKRPGKDRNKPA